MDIHSFTKPLEFNIVQLDSVSSTNNIAREIIAKDEAVEGLVITAEHQTEGRGQQNSTWQSDSGKNLLCSIVLMPTFLNISQQTFLNMAICLSVNDLLQSYIRSVKIKWPNDVYINNKKTAGILIENTIAGNSIKNTVAGIGLNLNQLHFNEPKATSLSIETGIHHAKEDILEQLLTCFRKRYAQLQLKQFEKIKQAYHESLLGHKQLKTFKTNEDVFDAIINGVDDDGRLVLQRMNKLEKFMVKQITML